MKKFNFLKKNKNLIPVLINNKEILVYKDYIKRQKNIKEFGYKIPIKSSNSNTNKEISLFFKVLKPEYFANAHKIKVSYVYENDVLTLEEWKIKAILDLTAKAMGLSNYPDKVLELIKEKDNKTSDIWDSLISITENEYEEISE